MSAGGSRLPVWLAVIVGITVLRGLAGFGQQAARQATNRGSAPVRAPPLVPPAPGRPATTTGDSREPGIIILRRRPARRVGASRRSPPVLTVPARDPGQLGRQAAETLRTPAPSPAAVERRAP